jgi:PIN domain nuclease of toxin-antitoxin system
MTLLLDTHTFLWFCQGDPALRAVAKTLIENAANRKFISVVSGDPLLDAYPIKRLW